MATPAQIDANRRNARKSTGPKTPAGKARSSRNALRHGLASDQIVLDAESEADFQALLAGYLDHYQPADPIEQTLVEEAAVAAWRLRRIRTLETVLFDYRFVLEQGFWNPRDRAKFDLNDPSWTLFRQAGAVLHGSHGDDALDRLSRYETRVRRAFYAAITELRRRKAKANPIEAVARTQSPPAESSTSGRIGFVLPNSVTAPEPVSSSGLAIPRARPHAWQPRPFPHPWGGLQAAAGFSVALARLAELRPAWELKFPLQFGHLNAPVAHASSVQRNFSSPCAGQRPAPVSAGRHRRPCNSCTFKPPLAYARSSVPALTPISRNRPFRIRHLDAGSGIPLPDPLTLVYPSA